MAEAEEKKIRKNRTFYSRVEEIEEMYGREPTAFELRALAELPLKDPGGKVSEPYDTSANGRRIRQLLELSEKNRDISYLDEAGALITFQAIRNPYTDHVESPWVYPQTKLRPIHSPQTTTSSRTIRLGTIPPPKDGSSLPAGASNTRILPTLPSALPLASHGPPAHKIPPIRNPVAPHHSAGNAMGGSFNGTSGGEPTTDMVELALLPNYTGWAGWNQNQPHRHYPTTAPQAYSLSDGYGNSNNYHLLPYHKSGMPPGNQNILNGVAGAHLPPTNRPPNLNDNQPIGSPSSELLPAGQDRSNDLAGAHPSFVMSLNDQGSSNASHSCDTQLSSMPPADHANLVGPAVPLPTFQAVLNSHPPGAHQPFIVDTRNQATPDAHILLDSRPYPY